MKILIGYDGSDCAEDAITDLQRAGIPPDGTEAMVFAAWDAFLPAGAADAGAGGEAALVVLRDVDRLRALVREGVERERAIAERGAAKVRGLFPGWLVRAAARADTPQWALVAMAAEWKADLVVVGSRGRSGLGRVLLGSVSQQVLHHAPCSVRVARCGAGHARPPVRLVLGIDGSVDSAAAASAVAARRWPAGSEVFVVGVLDSRVVLNYLPSDLAGGGPRGEADAHAASGLREALESVGDELRRSGLVANVTTGAGDAKNVLLQEAERVGADCIFVGAKGHTRLERLLLGSVSASVAARAPCSVEVVRHG